MVSQTESEASQEFVPSAKQSEDEESQYKQKSKGSSKKNQKIEIIESKSKDKKKQKGKKIQKKQPKRKKEKVIKSKAKTIENNDEIDLETVRNYMQKQNRPYSLINIYDNLHGEIKKSVLETYLDHLSSEQFLTCKEYGKSKVYFLNQNRFDVNNEELQTLSTELSLARQQYSIVENSNKKLSDELKLTNLTKTTEQLQLNYEQLNQGIQKILNKMQKVSENASETLNEQKVIFEEQEQKRLAKKLKMLKKVKKESIDIWCEILEKKKSQVAQIIGIDLY